MIRAVADVICGITFKEESDTTNPDLNKLLKLNADLVANTDDRQLAVILDFFLVAHCLPIKTYDRVLQPVFQMHEIIRKLLREREEIFNRTEVVEDFMSSLLCAKRDLQMNVKVTRREPLFFRKTILSLPSRTSFSLAMKLPVALCDLASRS